MEAQNDRPGPDPGYFALKRTLDILGAGGALIALSPVIAAAAAAIRVTMGSPVLFRQRRPGLHGEPFDMIKFRTMRHLRPGEDLTGSDGVRLTRLGRWLRRSSIDELPELANVLRGQMSLVGPRPLLMRYLGRYTPQQMRRHEAKPGITGWAQINGRNAISWEQKFALDVWYVDHRSTLLDLKILAQTVRKVLVSEGVEGQGVATASEFMGGT